ncbi:MAG: tripartite tricarboxylate transporter TctB family protein [Rhodobacteraceae bacterium]|nr:tripartite tricarboxylate transporter TctB family protein [Paracoccaceae bacterium]
MRLAELITAIVIALFSLYLMWESGEGPSWDPNAVRFANIGINVNNEGPGSGFWPFWLSLIMLICSVLVGFNWYRKTTPQSRSTEKYLDYFGLRIFALVGGGLIVFLLLIGVVGFYGAIPLFLIYYIYFIGRHPLWLTLMIAIAVPVFSFFFFDISMRIVLPKGLLEPLFIPLYDIFL